MQDKKEEKRISLAPLSVETALKGILSTKPDEVVRKKHKKTGHKGPDESPTKPDEA